MTSRHRRSWPLDQKRSLVTELAERTASGESFAEVARDLGIHQSTLRQWVAKLEPRSVLPVVVESSSDPRPCAGGTISLAAPGGFLFAGLDLPSAILLWERLR